MDSETGIPPTAFERNGSSNDGFGFYDPRIE
jgi:hypothetical protein